MNQKHLGLFTAMSLDIMIYTLCNVFTEGFHYNVSSVYSLARHCLLALDFMFERTNFSFYIFRWLQALGQLILS